MPISWKIFQDENAISIFQFGMAVFEKENVAFAQA